MSTSNVLQIINKIHGLLNDLTLILQDKSGEDYPLLGAYNTALAQIESLEKRNKGYEAFILKHQDALLKDMKAEVRQMMDKDVLSKIKAIKFLREFLPIGLKEAKEYVESL